MSTSASKTSAISDFADSFFLCLAIVWFGNQNLQITSILNYHVILLPCGKTKKATKKMAKKSSGKYGIG